MATKTPTTQTVTASFKLERETKNAVRYMEVDGAGNEKALDAGAAIGTLYVRKSAFKDGTPETFTLTLSY